jgi:hypothetical protein
LIPIGFGDLILTVNVRRIVGEEKIGVLIE